MKWWSPMAHRTCRPGGYTPRSASLWPHWSRGRWSSRARLWSEIIKLGWWHGVSPVQRVVQVGEQKKQPLGIETLKAVPNSIQNSKDQMNTKSTFYNSHCYFLHFEIYLSQILSAIKILLKQFLIDFLGYHLSSSYIQTFSEIWYRISFVALINPPWEDKNVDKVSNKTKDWHQDHQDADHPGELKYEKLMPLCPGRHSSQHFHCSGQSKQINESPACVCVIYLIYIKHPPLVRQWMGHEGRKEKWKQISFVILFESVKYILPYYRKSN